MKQPNCKQAISIDKLREHDPEAFKTLYDVYGAQLYGVILDIVQDPPRADKILHKVFVQAWLQIDQYDSNKLRLFTWLWQIARNLAVSTMLVKHENSFITSGRKLPGIQQLVTKLEEEDKYIVELCYYQNYTVEDIASKLGIPVETAKERILKAVKQLGDKITEAIKKQH